MAEGRALGHRSTPSRPVISICMGPTSGDDPLQPHDVAVVKLTQGQGLGQEAEPLRVGAAFPQRVHGHREPLAARELQAAATQLPKAPCGDTAPQTPPWRPLTANPAG